MNIKNLTAGQSFVADFTFGTVYVVDSVRSDGGLTTVNYHIVSQYASEGVKPTRGMFTRASLTTVSSV